MSKKKAPINPGRVNASTQRYIPFSEIRDGVLIMRDGTLRRVILVSSINFALKSDDEQHGIIQGYVSFLNSLDYELQIVIQSRKLNIDPYLESLDMKARQQDNELLRRQTRSYRSFIAQLVESADIMDKKFFVVVPFSARTNKKKNYWTRLQEVLRPASSVKVKQEVFLKCILEMDRRVNHVLTGLSGIGVQAQVLGTQELIELFYNTYNPITKQQKRIANINEMQVDRTLE